MVKRVLAIAAHPDDIEFMMVGTLLNLQAVGYEIHYMNIADGCCGTNQYDRETIIAMRREEAQAAAQSINAVYHESIAHDLEIFYEKSLLAELSAVVREMAPEIILTHALRDYMEDHMNTARLTVTAASARGMTNFQTIPEQKPTSQAVTIYHALPHGLSDGLRHRIRPGLYVDITSCMDEKREMLAYHKSQKEWLDDSQGMDSYLVTMQDMSRQTGELSECFAYAEGWTRHLHFGLAPEECDPLTAALQQKVKINLEFEKQLTR